MRPILRYICAGLLRGFTPVSRIWPFGALWSRLERMCRCRVADRDVWYRTITNQKHIKNNGRLHHAALKAFIDPPVIKTVEWKSEISGRLRSLADDIRADGERRAALQRERSPQLSRYLQFCAVVFTHPAEVRIWTIDRTDVLFDPKKDDAAHANVVFFNKLPNDLKDLAALSEIITNLSKVSVDNLALIPEPQGGPPS
jgi:hypothetical protein